MDILQIVGLCITATALVLVLRRDRPEIALQIGLAVSAIVFIAIASRLVSTLTVLRDLAERAQVNTLHLNVVLKIIGVAYVTEFGAQICRDANESAIAGKVELAGKVIILALAIPIVLAVMDAIIRLLPG
jgi:stage III sporulation protein AD